MRPDPAREFLHRALEGVMFEESDLRALMLSAESEGLWVDFKDGKLTEDKGKCAAVVRQYVSGFANAEGGLLVIGISDEQPRKITATRRPGGKSLDAWAADVLAELRSWLTPAPKIQVVKAEGTEVLVIAVARSPRLVPCVDGRDTKYFLRFGHGTYEVPSYLATDLILGRRNHPLLEVELPQNFQVNTGGNPGCVEVTFSFSVHNVGLVTADDPLVGALCWAGPGATDASLQRLVRQPILRELSTHVEAIEPPPHKGGRFKLVGAISRKQYNAEEGASLGPFTSARFMGVGPFPIAYDGWVSVRGAMFVIANGHPAQWHEFEFTLFADGRNEPKIRAVRVERTIGRNPAVSWGPLKDVVRDED